VDLSAEIVALMSAKTQFSASLSILKTADDIQKNALDVMA
jgi:flagellar hook protein FlgE